MSSKRKWPYVIDMTWEENHICWSFSGPFIYHVAGLKCHDKGPQLSCVRQNVKQVANKKKRRKNHEACSEKSIHHTDFTITNHHVD